MKQSAAVLLRLSVLLAAGPAAADWPAFRGDGSSRADGAAPPDAWSIEEGRNVAWTADLPGRGVSGPIAVGSRVVVTASDGPSGERLHVIAFDAATGDRDWSRHLWATGNPNAHETSANAAPTPASDGERVFAFFSSSDLVAIRLDGSVEWVRGLALDHPKVGNDIGMASSPVVAGDAVVVQAESQGESFAMAVDRRTGRTLWDLERPLDSNWASPLPWVTADGRAAVWLQDNGGASLHDAATGERLARIDADCGSVPSPTPAGGGRLLLTTGGLSVFTAPFERPTLRASKLQPGSPSPVVWENSVIVVNRGGVVAAADLATGDVLWRRRLGGQFWATPVAAGGRLYCVNADGEANVLDLSDGGGVLSTAKFGEGILGSPAVSDGAVYFRSHKRLWKIATVEQAEAPANTEQR